MDLKCMQAPPGSPVQGIRKVEFQTPPVLSISYYLAGGSCMLSAGLRLPAYHAGCLGSHSEASDFPHALHKEPGI